MIRFSSVSEVEKFLISLELMGMGSQGTVYKSKNGKYAYKIFHDFEEEDFNDWTQEEILKFSDVKNDTYIFPIDTIMLKDTAIGYITEAIVGKDLCNVNPFMVDLNFLVYAIEKALFDVQKISEGHVWTYDVMYNIMLGKNIYVVDSLEYSRLWAIPSKEIYEHNIYTYNMGFMYFLVDDYFDDVVNSNKILREMYMTKGKGISIIEFIETFKKYLSELVGREVTCLDMARKYVNKRRKGMPEYIRSVN